MIKILVLFSLAVALSFARLFTGPSAPDRLVALANANNLILVCFVILAALYERWYLVDLSILYALLSFVGTAIIAKHIGGEL